MINIDKIKFSSGNNFFLIAGPCAIERREVAFQVAEKICEISEKLMISFIFKVSYHKCNNTKLDSFT